MNGRQADYQYLDESGNVTARNLYNDKGVRTNYQIVNAQTGTILEDRQFDGVTGAQVRTLFYSGDKLSAIADFANGHQIDYLYVDENRNVVARNLYNPNGIRTNYQLISPATGELLEDRQFDGVTGTQLRNVYFQGGKPVAIADFANGHQVNYQYLNDFGRVTAQVLFNADGGKTNYQRMDPTSGKIEEDQQFDGVTGDHLRNLHYEDGRLVGEADFVSGKQVNWKVIEPTSGAITQVQNYDPATGKMTSKCTFTDGHCAVATYDADIVWVETEVHATLDLNSAVVTRYWTQEGRLHRSWTDGAGQTGESVYNGSSISSGLLHSEFTDTDGWRHMQDYQNGQGIDYVKDANGNLKYKATDAKDSSNRTVLIQYSDGHTNIINGRLSEAAEASASLSGASGVTSVIVPYTPPVSINSAPVQSGGRVLPADSYGNVVNTPPAARDSDCRWNPPAETCILVIANPTLQGARLRIASSEDSDVVLALESDGESPSRGVQASLGGDCCTAQNVQTQVDKLISDMAGFNSCSVATIVPRSNDSTVEVALAAANC